MTTEIRPDEAFHLFLEKMTRQGWIKAHSWHPFRRGALDAAFSKSHKQDDSGHEFQIEVESPDGFRCGVDLEFYVPGRPLFQNPDWLERRFGIPVDSIKALRSEQLLEEWAYREAAFKSLYPHNEGVVLSDFERSAPGEMRIRRGEEEYHFALQGEWQGSWFMALARRNF